MARPILSRLAQRRAPSILPMGSEAAFDRAARRSCPRQREFRRRIAGALVGAVLVSLMIVALIAARGLA